MEWFYVQYFSISYVEDRFIYKMYNPELIVTQRNSTKRNRRNVVYSKCVFFFLNLVDRNKNNRGFQINILLLLSKIVGNRRSNELKTNESITCSATSSMNARAKKYDISNDNQQI